MNRPIAAILLWLVTLACPAGADLIDGRDYVAIEPRPANAGPRVEVIEFFYYGCAACYQIEPALREWVSGNAASIDFKLVPGLRRRAWASLSDLFFALHSMGVLGQMHHRVYAAIHEQGLRLSSRREQLRWVAEQGLDVQAFESTVASDATQIATQQARDATLAYGIRVTPSIVVDGRYLTTAGMIGSDARLPYVLDRLLQMALARRDNESR